MKFSVGDTVQDRDSGVKGFVTESDLYVDIFGDGCSKEDYWVGGQYVDRHEKLTLTRIVIVEKSKKYA